MKGWICEIQALRCHVASLKPVFIYTPVGFGKDEEHEVQSFSSHRNLALVLRVPTLASAGLSA